MQAGPDQRRNHKTFFQSKQWSRKQLFALLKGNKPSSRAPNPNPCPWPAPQLQAISGKLLCFNALGTCPDSGGPSLPSCPRLIVSLSSRGKNPFPWLIALTLETKMPLQDLRKDMFLLSAPSSLYLHPPQPYTHWNMGSWKTEHGCPRSCCWERCIGQPSLL